MAFKTIDQLITDIEQTQNQITYWKLQMKNGSALLFTDNSDLSIKEQADRIQERLNEDKWIRIGDDTSIRTEEVQAYGNVDMDEVDVKEKKRHIYHRLRKRIKKHHDGLIERDELVENMDEKLMLKNMVEDGEAKIVNNDYTRYVKFTGEP